MCEEASGFSDHKVRTYNSHPCFNQICRSVISIYNSYFCPDARQPSSTAKKSLNAF